MFKPFKRSMPKPKDTFERRYFHPEIGTSDQALIQPKQIIAVGGAQGAGKDTFIGMLCLELGEEWEFLSTSDTVIHLYAKRTGLNPTEIRKNKQTYRTALQALGDELEKDDLAAVVKRTLLDGLEYPKIILESIRRPSEVWYLNRLGAQLVLLDADRDVREKRRGKLIGEGHITETGGVIALRENPRTWIVQNNGTLDDLKAEVKRFAREYRNQARMLI